MSDHVRLRVREVPGGTTFEARVPTALTVGEVGELLVCLMRSWVAVGPCAHDRAQLMLVEGTNAGMFLDASESIESFVHTKILFDGALLAVL